MKNEANEDLLEYFKSHVVNPKRRFVFHCDGCGKCCENREDIILSGWDLYQLALFLKRKNTLEIIREFCEVYIGQESRIPVCRLKSIGFERRCPFLMKNKKCKVHKMKPSVCALFPLGRVYNGETKEVQYILQDINCGLKDRSQSIQEWIDAFNLNENIDLSKKWSSILFDLAGLMSKMSDSLSEGTLKMLYNAIYQELYLYVPEQPFEAQLDEHRDRIGKLCQVLKGENLN